MPRLRNGRIGNSLATVMAFTGLMSTSTSAPKVCLSALLRPGLEACLVELPVKNGPLELIQFPGVFIMLRKTETPVEPPAGAIVNHFGFTVKDMPAALAKWKAANLTIDPTENPNEVYVNAPDGIRLEVYGEPALPTPVSMNHIHYNAPDIPGIKAWYVKAFGANARARGSAAFPVRP